MFIVRSFYDRELFKSTLDHHFWHGYRHQYELSTFNNNNKQNRKKNQIKNYHIRLRNATVYLVHCPFY